MRDTKDELLARTRKDVAEYIGASDVDEVVLVENASSGINAVMRSLKFNPGDKILVYGFLIFSRCCCGLWSLMLVPFLFKLPHYFIEWLRCLLEVVVYLV